MDRYQYQRLKRGDIRLLRFSSYAEGDLSFDIQHQTFNETTPPYIALSYTWGEARFPHRLIIGNRFLAITENLRDALVHVRRLANLERKNNLIWVDAICIDQSNNAEKDHQIGLMTSLYRRASQIYVWLGVPENDAHVRLAMEKMDLFSRRLTSAMKAEMPYRPWWWPKKVVRMEDRQLNILSKFPVGDSKVFDVEGSQTHAAWLGIVEIWQKPWWNRTWILQESTVEEDNTTIVFWGMAVDPTRKVRFLCGEYSTHWAGINMSLRVADHLQSMSVLKTDFMAGKSDPVRKVLQVKAYRFRKNKDPIFGFLELLQLFRHSDCSDPRDKVYALLGLAPDFIRHHVIPSYEKSALDVYIDVVRHALNQPTPDLNFLGYAMKLDSPQRRLSAEISHTTWPSWVPNWDDPLPLYPIPKALFTRDAKEQSYVVFPTDNRVTFTHQRAYNASDGLSVDATLSNYQLHVKGILVDVIVDTFDFNKTTRDERRGKCNAWFAKLRQKYPTTEAFNAVLAHVQVADIQYNVDGYPSSRNAAVSFALLDKPRAELTAEEFQAQSRMWIAFSRAKAFRGVCLTAKGYLGLVPVSARKGDRLCVFLGGQVLYVLRPNGGVRAGNDKNEYIGECYAHGLTDGEVMQWLREGRVAVERFALV